MIKTTPSFAGADVSARWVDVAVDECDGKRRTKRFNNDASGHNKLCAWILKHSRAVRIVVEATGLYSLDLALRLHGSRGVESIMTN